MPVGMGHSASTRRPPMLHAPGWMNELVETRVGMRHEHFASETQLSQRILFRLTQCSRPWNLSSSTLGIHESGSFAQHAFAQSAGAKKLVGGSGVYRPVISRSMGTRSCPGYGPP